MGISETVRDTKSVKLGKSGAIRGPDTWRFQQPANFFLFLRYLEKIGFLFLLIFEFDWKHINKQKILKTKYITY